MILDGLEFQLSDRKNKKLKVWIPELNKWVHFGDCRYQHFFDKTGLINKSYNHYDLNRRRKYLNRSKNINKGRNNEYPSPNYFAQNYLW